MPSPLDTNRRVMLLAGRRLEFLRSTSIFFIATRPVWFTCQPSIVVNQFKVPTDLSIQKQGFMDGFLGNVGNVESVTCRSHYSGDETNPLSAPFLVFSMSCWKNEQP